MPLKIIILAAGVGKRMHSSLPKCLHTLAGKSLLEHVVDTAKPLEAAEIYVVYGYYGERLREALPHLNVTWVAQSKPLGTGHAVKQALPHLKKQDRALILPGDVPLIATNTLRRLIQHTPKTSIGWLATHMKNPKYMGRIIRNEKGYAQAIVEEQDATKSQKKIHEVNTGICLIPANYLHEWLPKLKNKNAQHEYYLTDILKVALKNNIDTIITSLKNHHEILGVNDHSQLAYLERLYQQQLAQSYMQKGLTLLDPARFDVRGKLSFGKDVIIDVNVIIEGRVQIGANTYIGPNTLLRDVKIGSNVTIHANSVLEKTVVGNHCTIGPFARLRHGTQLGRNVKLGNFVETKNAKINHHTKINHLSYMGDAILGKQVNIGAGTITCNYDGVKKWQTIIEDGAFIGANASLVAPITIGQKSNIGAGSVIIKNTPQNKLTLARSKQITIDHWVRPQDRKE